MTSEGSIDLATVVAALRGATGDDSIVADSLERLTGGASREIWALTMKRNGSARRVVLRCDPPGDLEPHSGEIEAHTMAAARAAGVPVPEVVAVSTGRVNGLFLERVDGETVPTRILRSTDLADARAGLARECGCALGRLHTVIPSDAVPVIDRLVEYRNVLDALGQRRAVLEVAYAWLIAHRPSPRPGVVSHGDFRLGNLVVGQSGLRAVLDWESTHVSTPLEDLGWLCAPPWRFNGNQPVGGFGTIDDLLCGYADGGGSATITKAELHWAIVLGTWVWAVGCLQQCERHRIGTTPSVDLAAVGRRVVENESDLLELIFPEGPRTPLQPTGPGRGDADGAHLPFGPPTLVELLDAVRMTLDEEFLPTAEGRQRYLLRVCISVLEMGGREVGISTPTPVDPSVDDEIISAMSADGWPGLDDSTADTLFARTVALLDVVSPRRATTFRARFSTGGERP